jgi:predicted porin
MKRSLAPLLTLACACSASAQSSLTLFGVVDAGVATYDTRRRDAAGRAQGARRTALVNSGFNSSRLGVRGTEDLGGGASASFWPEGALGNDDGGANTGFNFQRRSTVSLAGPWGELRLGRDYTATFWNDSLADPFGQVGPGTNLLLAASTNAPGFAGNAGNYARASNSVGYFLPAGLGGFYGQLMYAFSENLSNAGRAGEYSGIRLGYAHDALDVAASYAVNVMADDPAARTRDRATTASAYAAYDFKWAKFTAEISHLRSSREYAVVPAGGGVRPVDISGGLLGVIVPVGAGTIRASYARVDYDVHGAAAVNPRASKIAVGYSYNLSRRTVLYVTGARASNHGGAALTVGNPAPAFATTAGTSPLTSTGIVAGIRHSF